MKLENYLNEYTRLIQNFKLTALNQIGSTTEAIQHAEYSLSSQDFFIDDVIQYTTVLNQIASNNLTDKLKKVTINLPGENLKMYEIYLMYTLNYFKCFSFAKPIEVHKHDYYNRFLRIYKRLILDYNDLDFSNFCKKSLTFGNSVIISELEEGRRFSRIFRVTTLKDATVTFNFTINRVSTNNINTVSKRSIINITHWSTNRQYFKIGVNYYINLFTGVIVNSNYKVIGCLRLKEGFHKKLVEIIVKKEHGLEYNELLKLSNFEVYILKEYAIEFGQSYKYLTNYFGEIDVIFVPNDYEFFIKEDLVFSNNTLECREVTLQTNAADILGNKKISINDKENKLISLYTEYIEELLQNVNSLDVKPVEIRKIIKKEEEQIPLTEEELRETQEALAELAALETNALVESINIDEIPEQSDSVEDIEERVHSISRRYRNMGGLGIDPISSGERSQLIMQDEVQVSREDFEHIDLPFVPSAGQITDADTTNNLINEVDSIETVDQENSSN